MVRIILLQLVCEGHVRFSRQCPMQMVGDGDQGIGQIQRMPGKLRQRSDPAVKAWRRADAGSRLTFRPSPIRSRPKMRLAEETGKLPQLLGSHARIGPYQIVGPLEKDGVAPVTSAAALPRRQPCDQRHAVPQGRVVNGHDKRHRQATLPRPPGVIAPPPASRLPAGQHDGRRVHSPHAPAQLGHIDRSQCSPAGGTNAAGTGGARHARAERWNAEARFSVAENAGRCYFSCSCSFGKDRQRGNLAMKYRSSAATMARKPLHPSKVKSSAAPLAGPLNRKQADQSPVFSVLSASPW